MAVVKSNGEIYRLSRKSHQARRSTSSSYQKHQINRLLSQRSEDRPILWVLRPHVSDQESTSIAVTVVSVLVVLLAGVFLFRYIRARRFSTNNNNNNNNDSWRRRSLWAGIAWQKGQSGEASFVPDNSQYQAILDQSPAKSKSIAGVVNLFSKKKNTVLSSSAASISPYPFKVTPRTSYKLFGSSTSPPASPYTDLTPLQSPEDCLRRSTLPIDVLQDAVSSSLTAPQRALCSPSLRFNNDLSKYSTQRKTATTRKSSLVISPSVDQDASLSTFPEEPNVYFNKKQDEEARMIGLGLKMGESSTSSRLENQIQDNSKGSLRWQPIEALSPSDRKAKEAQEKSSDKGKRKAREIIADEPLSPRFEPETIEEYTGPIYADQIANALKEAQVEPAPLWNTGETMPKEQEDGRRFSQMGDFTLLYYETMEKLQDRSRRRSTLIQRSQAVKSRSTYCSTKDRFASESTAKSLIGAAISVDLSSSSPLSAAKIFKSDQVGVCRHQRTRTKAIDFHLPLRTCHYTGMRPLCSSPESIRRESLQVIKIRGRCSLVPNIHIPSASIDTEASDTTIFREIPGYSFQPLFWKELGQSKKSSRIESRTYQQDEAYLKSYSDEERELDREERKVSSRSSKGGSYISQSRCSTMSTSHSTAVLCYRQLPSRFSSFSTASGKSTASHYSQESRQSVAAPNLVSPKTIISRDIDQEFHSRKTRSSTSSNSRRGSDIMICKKRNSRRSTTSFDSSFYWDLNDFSLSSFPAVPPLPNQHHQLLSLMSDEGFQNIFHALNTTQPLRLFRNRSPPPPPPSANASSTSRHTSARHSDHISPTLIISRLYEKKESETNSDSNQTQEEEDV